MNDSKEKPRARYYDGQIVKTSSKHYIQKKFTMVIDPTWNEKRGWIYGERYLSKDWEECGRGYWNEEDMFEELTDPEIIIRAEIYLRNKEINIIRIKLDQLNAQVDKLKYTLHVINTKGRDYNEAGKT